MHIETWWHDLTPESRAWLIANNGVAVRPDIVAEITKLRGSIVSGAWWETDHDDSGFFLPDEATDWIEARANEE